MSQRLACDILQLARIFNASAPRTQPQIRLDEARPSTIDYFRFMEN